GGRMRTIKAARPSPALVVAVLALVAGLAGTAVADPELSKKKVTTKKVKKIADKEANAVLNARAGEFAPGAAEPYHEAGAAAERGFEGNWHNYGPAQASVAFAKDPWGFVHLKGQFAGSPAMGSTMFTLPAGYRPAKGTLIPLANISAGLNYLQVTADGRVVASCAGGTCIEAGIDGLSFPAGQ